MTDERNQQFCDLLLTHYANLYSGEPKKPPLMHLLHLLHVGPYRLDVTRGEDVLYLDVWRDGRHVARGTVSKDPPRWEALLPSGGSEGVLTLLQVAAPLLAQRYLKADLLPLLRTKYPYLFEEGPPQALYGGSGVITCETSAAEHRLSMTPSSEEGEVVRVRYDRNKEEWDTGLRPVLAYDFLFSFLRQDPAYGEQEKLEKREQEGSTQPMAATPAKEENTMTTNEEIKERVKKEAADAAWRTAASQLVKLTREPLVAVLSRHLGPDDETLRKKIADFLATEAGSALMAGVLSLALSTLPDTMQGAAQAQHLSRELRVKAMADMGDLVADVLMGPMRQVLCFYIQDTAALPALPEAAASPELAPKAKTEEEIFAGYTAAAQYTRS